jgi:hypothetical protein
MRGISAASGDVSPAHGSSSVVGPGIHGLYLLGSPSSLHPPINWWWVGDKAESTCPQVTAMERLLHERLPRSTGTSCA